MMDELMLKIDNVSKQYKLGQIGGTTLRNELQRKRAKRRGEEDPTKRIGEKTYAAGETFMALDGVSFEVKKGERVGIIGHNGAGKSTLLKLISRVTAPTSGMIGLNGRIASMLEVGTGFHPELTGRENVYMNGAILGMTKAEIDAKMEDIIEFSEVRQFIDTPVKRYSSGMYVKLAFSVAAHLDSEIMIMDEVLAVGDMAFQKKCLDKMNDVSRKDGRTILYVSHNMNTIRQLCDKCIVLDKGKILFEGDVDKAIAIYLGNKSQKSCHVSLAEIKRENWVPATELKMMRFDVNDREVPVFRAGEVLNGVLTCKAFKDIDDVYFRVTIKDDENQPVTMTQTMDAMSIKVGEEKHFNLAIDISQLVPGGYYFSFTLFRATGYTQYECVDWLPRNFEFEIEQPSGFNHNIPWRKSVWGNFYSSDIKILSTY